MPFFASEVATILTLSKLANVSFDKTSRIILLSLEVLYLSFIVKLLMSKISLLSSPTYSASKSESLLQENTAVNIKNITITFGVSFGYGYKRISRYDD